MAIRWDGVSVAFVQLTIDDLHGALETDDVSTQHFLICRRCRVRWAL